MKMSWKMVFLAVFLVLGSSAVVNAGLTDGLISHWRFDEASGIVAHDSAGSNHGSLNGIPAWVAGMVGSGALDFDGLNDYVLVPNDPSQQITTNQITLSAWIKLSSEVGNRQARIINKQVAYHGGIAWGFELFGNGYGGSTGNQLVFHDSDGVSSWRNCMSTTDLQIETWYHVAVTDNAGLIKIYIDGVRNACNMVITVN